MILIHPRLWRLVSLPMGPQTFHFHCQSGCSGIDDDRLLFCGEDGIAHWTLFDFPKFVQEIGSCEENVMASRSTRFSYQQEPSQMFQMQLESQEVQSAGLAARPRQTHTRQGGCRSYQGVLTLDRLVGCPTDDPIQIEGNRVKWQVTHHPRNNNSCHTNSFP